MTVQAPAKRAQGAAAERRPRLSRILRGAGWAFITAGALVLLFVAYQLFVTNLITDRYQKSLRGDLSRELRTGGTRGSPVQPVPGDALGILRIPRIDLDVVVVEGVEVEDLKKGPGRYPDTPLPGEPGNVGIAGHRTTYGKPFWALDKLRSGDEVSLRTREGTFVYEVRWKRVVSPDALGVLGPSRRPSITLTTCHPRFSAAERLIVRGRLVRAPPGVEAA